MARKKKTNQIEKKLVSKITSPVTNLTGDQTISYAGHVCVKVNHGNNTILTKHYHNSGMPNLFKFLCNCLAGEYTDKLRPCKIKLFSYLAGDELPDEEKSKLENFNWVTNFSNPSIVDEKLNPYRPVSATPFIVYDTTPVVMYKEDPQTQNKYYETTFHFRVPFTLLSRNTIYMIGFFPNNAYEGNEANASAYYLFTEIDDESKKAVWKPLVLDESVTGNYSIIIDWTMSITNKQTTTIKGE